MSSSTDAVFAPILARLNDGDYAAAQTAIDKALALRGPKALPASARPSLQHIQAYVAYRLGKLPEALDAARRLPTEFKAAHATGHLEAQTLYKMGKFADAAAAYDAFVDDAALAADAEVLVNVLATLVAAGRAADAVAMLERIGTRARLASAPAGAAAAAAAAASAGVSHEVVFNAACALAEQGDLTAATAAVEQAKAMLRAQVAAAEAEADVDDDGEAEERAADLEAELAVVQLQGAYIKQLAGDEDAAAAVYSALAASAVVAARQPVAAAIAANNTAALRRNGGKASFEAVRKLDHALAQAGDKLLPKQRQTLDLNAGLLLAHCNKPVEARERLKAGAADAETLALVAIAALVKDKAYAKAEATARDHVAAHPSAAKSLRARLALVHLPLLRDNYAVAIAALEDLIAASEGADWQGRGGALRFKPAVTAVLLAIHGRAGDAAGAEAVLDAAVAHWEKELAAAGLSEPARRARAQSLLHSLQSQAAELKMRAGRAAEAVALLESLAARAQASGDDEGARRYLVQVVSTVVESDPAKAQRLLAQLPGADADAKAAAGKLDVDALEAGPAPAITDAAAATAAAAKPAKTRKVAMDDEEDEDGRLASDDDAEDDDESAAAAASAVAYLPNGKRVLSPEKLAQVRARNKRRRVPTLPGNMTAEQAAANIAASKGPNPHRWLPKWERPAAQQAKGKAAKGAIARGPQGSGVSENKTEVSTVDAKPHVMNSPSNNDKRPRNKRR